MIVYIHAFPSIYNLLDAEHVNTAKLSLDVLVLCEEKFAYLLVDLHVFKYLIEGSTVFQEPTTNTSVVFLLSGKLLRKKSITNYR